MPFNVLKSCVVRTWNLTGDTKNAGTAKATMALEKTKRIVESTAGRTMGMVIFRMMRHL